MQAQHRFVEFDMQGQNFSEIGFGHAQDRAFPMGVGIVGAPVAVEDRDVAEPDSGFHIGQRNLLSRN